MKRISPHDTVFKQFLANPETAQDFLSIHLPGALRDLCDLSTLRLESGSFIEPDLRPHYSDILYGVSTSGGDGYIYCVIEHQSTPDRLMAFRLMRYCLAAMQSHLDKGHRQLPLVIPLLFYHGSRSPYPFSTCWLDLFDHPEGAGQLYSGSFPLVDVTVLSDDEIMQHKRIALLELVQKHIRQKDMLELVPKLVALMGMELWTNEQIGALLNYISLASDTAKPEELLRAVAAASPKYEEMVMTIAERLEQKGLEKGLKQGLKQGLEQGLEQGRQKERREVAMKMLSGGIDPATVKAVTGLSDLEMTRLHH